ncbi:MAG: hypothetical protein K2W96_13535, partial [Gemmataceae bacterium]|nr:hypothetical protein [Gemmataceae bacterium]
MKKLAAPFLVLLPGLAWAGAMAPPPASSRIAWADAAYVGTVVAVEEKAVPAKVFEGDRRKMRLATVKVAETLLGKAAREMKVGCFVLPDGRSTAEKGQEGVFLLHKHPALKGVHVFSDYQGLFAKDA